MTFIATFYSHFGSIRFKRICDGKNLKAKFMPVPRGLSSSCGTCVCYDADAYIIPEEANEELEQIAQVQDGKFTILFRAENS